MLNQWYCIYSCPYDPYLHNRFTARSQTDCRPDFATQASIGLLRSLVSFKAILKGEPRGLILFLPP